MVAPNKVHMLLADDDPLLRRLIGGAFAKRGFDLIYAADGNEAREVTRRLKPDIVLLDYRMPVFDGLKTASYLKKEPETKDIPIILLTNEDFPLEGEKYLKDLGVDDYVHKGADFEDILDKVKQVMKAHGRDIDSLVGGAKAQSIAPQ
ncbi:MAG: hypothetical protein A2722_00885 [Candidatus Doudnabacteria bacterium RIFCSPHIGHO2_01_FULL_50_11]|uniref:Response regulatory domain-containing protein n=1 Tax=Candidatus Doudnabacteria bacterium RIFCSPHIGHO2_01_FULL_50_11 TaxID=1817828 RepID=A0A1F5PEZ0_9BACT|nr:MAG: hypothetical protein A2722_00885 [Candidatus Doudnabacteria bacterium RIFCSPHIGHO2_01_FULL_50_11]HLC44582.1 response regulator [Patescibacteria group bacterium]